MKLGELNELHMILPILIWSCGLANKYLCIFRIKYSVSVSSVHGALNWMFRSILILKAKLPLKQREYDFGRDTIIFGYLIFLIWNNTFMTWFTHVWLNNKINFSTKSSWFCFAGFVFWFCFAGFVLQITMDLCMSLFFQDVTLLSHELWFAN